MYDLLSFLHFFGMSLLVGGEVLVAIIAIKAGKDETALRFFVGFLRSIAAFFWVGLILSIAGGVGMVILQPEFARSIAFTVKMVLVAVILVIALIMAVRIGQIDEIFKRSGSAVRDDRAFKNLDLLSRINLLIVIAIVAISTQL